MAYRTAVHDATKFTPAYLMFGHELRTPVDLVFGIRRLRPGDDSIRLPGYLNQLKERMDVAHNFARNNIQEKGQVMKRRYDVRASAPRFNPGQLVWLTNTARGKGRSRKLRYRYMGPYTIVHQVNAVNHVIQLTSRSKQKTGAC